MRYVLLFLMFVGGCAHYDEYAPSIELVPRYVNYHLRPRITAKACKYDNEFEQNEINKQLRYQITSGANADGVMNCIWITRPDVNTNGLSCVEMSCRPFDVFPSNEHNKLLLDPDLKKDADE